jgi:adenylylsulfate kinase
MMGSTPERSFVKGICWEAISFLLTLLIVYLIYKNIIISLKITIILTIIKIPIYFIHERVWKKIKWGKIKDGKKNTRI